MHDFVSSCSLYVTDSHGRSEEDLSTNDAFPHLVTVLRRNAAAKPSRRSLEAERVHRALPFSGLRASAPLRSALFPIAPSSVGRDLFCGASTVPEPLLRCAPRGLGVMRSAPRGALGMPLRIGLKSAVDVGSTMVSSCRGRAKACISVRVFQGALGLRSPDRCPYVPVRRGGDAMSRGVKRTLMAVCVAWLGVALLTSNTAPLPEAATLTLEWPAAAPPAGMSLRHLSTGVIRRNAAFAYRGGSFFDGRDFAMSAVLVTHPGGDLLIDSGFSRKLAQQLQLMPWWFRAITWPSAWLPAEQQLRNAGYDRARLRAIVLTHAHWDHASGVADFAGTPVWVTEAERRFISDGDWRSAVARSAARAQWQTYRFEPKPYLGFAESRDVYGDGSVVIVPAPGHTPGGVIVFVVLPGDLRYAFIGDLAWQVEGVLKRAERPLWTRMSADADADAVRRQLQHMAALKQCFPELHLVPAHDARAYASIPSL